jgi:hypothetical protein
MSLMRRLPSAFGDGATETLVVTVGPKSDSDETLLEVCLWGHLNAALCRLPLGVAGADRSACGVVGVVLDGGVGVVVDPVAVER